MILNLIFLRFIISVTAEPAGTQLPVVEKTAAVVQNWQMVAAVVGSLLLLGLGLVGIGILLYRRVRRRRPEKPMTARGYEAYLLAIADSHKRLAFWTSIINSNELTPEFSPLGQAIADKEQQTELEIEEIAEALSTREEGHVSTVPMPMVFLKLSFAALGVGAVKQLTNPKPSLDVTRENA